MLIVTKQKLFISAILPILLLTYTQSAVAAQPKDLIPSGWTKQGINAENFTVTIDKLEFVSGGTSTVIMSNTNEVTTKDTVFVSQYANAEDYAGSRLRVSFYLKAQSMIGSAGLSFQTRDSAGEIVDRTYTAFTKIEELTDWTKTTIVIDISDSSTYIYYGAYLTGQGKIWFDNVSIEIVPYTANLLGETYEESE